MFGEALRAFWRAGVTAYREKRYEAMKNYVASYEKSHAAAASAAKKPARKTAKRKAE